MATFETLQIWIGHNAGVTMILTCYFTRYHIFSLSYSLDWGYLLRIITRYHQIYKKYILKFF